MTTGLEVGDINLADLTFWARPPQERLAAFARLRRLEHPVFFSEPRVPFMRGGGGFYALVRHADVVEASRTPAVFSSEPAVTTPEPPRWTAKLFGESMVDMDDPKHARLRRIISRAFSPRMLSRIEQDVARTAARLVDEAIASGPGDFITAIAGQLPIQVICDLMAIPQADRPPILARVSTAAEYSGARADFRRAALMFAKNAKVLVDMRRLAVRLARERRENPGDDLVSALVNANIDGERLSSRELGSFFSLLLVAGNETTRNALTHGLKLFTDHPEQRELLMSDFDARIGPAIEEIVRYVSPIIQFRRTVTRDHEMNGHRFAAGDKVVLFYTSANRDEAVFDDPDTFDITRRPNPHVGFGGPGPHHCLGAHLARMEMRIMFRELFTRLPDVRADGEPQLLLSHFENAVKQMPYTFTRPRAA